MVDETPGNPQILVRLPAEIGIPLLRDAKKKKCTVQAVLLEIAAAHYGVTVEPPKRGRKAGPKTQKQKQLRMWNGPFLGRQHCYVAAYSVADANRLMMQASGREHGSFSSYIREYFSECWGTPMAGIIPERGLWAKSATDRAPKRLV